MPFNPNAPYASGKGADYDRMTSAEKKRYYEQHGGNFDWGGAGKGAIGGAIAGGMTAGPWGALAGGIGGGFLGGRAGAEQNKADATRRGALDQAIASQGDMSRDMNAQRERDLANTMGFYGPSLQALEHLYGIPMSAWGQGLPQNRPAGPPPQTGMVNGMPAQAAPMRPEMATMFDKPVGGALKPLPGVQRAPTTALGGMFRRPLR